MFSNADVCERFREGKRTGEAHNLFIEGNVLYSFGRHYPLAIRFSDGWAINTEGYSQSTSRHRTHMCRALGYEFKELLDNRPDHIILLSTTQMRYVLYNRFSTIKLELC